MGNKKFTLTTIGLFLLIIVLIGAIFLISLKLKEEGQNSTPVSLIKTKAAEKTYSKDILIKPTTARVPTRTVIDFISPTPTEGALLTTTPTPTEIIVALNISSTSATIVPTHSYLSPTPTVIASLPSAGYFSYSLVFFIVSSLIVVVSFIF